MSEAACLPLSGLGVVELGNGWSAALAGSILAQLGAAVTKVRFPGESDVPELFGRTPQQTAVTAMLVNGHKTHISIEELDSVAVQRLFDGAQVILINESGERAWQAVRGEPLPAYETVADRAVLCHISAFGTTGPLANAVASDLTLQAMSGVMATTGEVDGVPMRAGVELSGVVGGLYAVIGVLSALIERARSGHGQVVQVALYDCLVSTLTNFASRVLAGIPPLPRLGNQGPNTSPWNLFETTDDKYVYIIAGSEPTFRRLCSVMGRDELANDQRFDTAEHRRAHGADITRTVGEWAATRTADNIVGLLRESGVPVSLVATMADLLAEPHFAHRRLLGSTNAGQVAGHPLGLWTASVPTDAPDPPAPDGLTPPSPSPSVDDGVAQRTRPLAGVRVIELGSLTAGPFCSRLLANLGADVVKVEPPEGEAGRVLPPMRGAESVYFHMTNNDKRSVSVDLGDPAGQQRLRSLASRSHIFVENLAPGVLAKRGLGPAELHSVNSDLIYASVSGFGKSGPLGGQRAYDTVVQAGAGLMSLTGRADGPPLKTGISSADVLGALCTAASVLAALFGQRRGLCRGLTLDVSLFDAVAWSTQSAWTPVLTGSSPVIRHGNCHWCLGAQGLFDTTDGLIALGAVTDAEWRGLCAVVEDLGVVVDSDLAAADQHTRYEWRADIHDLVAGAVRDRPCADVLARCAERRVPAAPVLEVADVLRSPHLKARGLVVDMELPDGTTMSAIDIPIRFSATPCGITHCAPHLGSSNTSEFDEKVIGAGQVATS